MKGEISMDDHLHLLRRLRRLQQAVADALESVSYGNVRPVTPAEAEEHARRYGEGACVLGEFVITERGGLTGLLAGSYKAPPPSALPDSINFDPSNGSGRH